MDAFLLPIWGPLHLPRYLSWVGKKKPSKFWLAARFADQRFAVSDLESQNLSLWIVHGTEL